MKKRYTDEQVIGFLQEAEGGVPLKELCRRHGFLENSFYVWRNKFEGMNISDTKRLRGGAGDRECQTEEAAGRIPVGARGQPRGHPKKLVTAPARRAMLSWAHGRGVTLRLIEPGKPNQNAYVESFNERFRDECLNENWFLNLAHAKSIIEIWRQEYNDERPKSDLEFSAFLEPSVSSG